MAVAAVAIHLHARLVLQARTRRPPMIFHAQLHKQASSQPAPMAWQPTVVQSNRLIVPLVTSPAAALPSVPLVAVASSQILAQLLVQHALLDTIAQPRRSVIRYRVPQVPTVTVARRNAPTVLLAMLVLLLRAVHVRHVHRANFPLLVKLTAPLVRQALLVHRLLKQP